MNAAIPEVMIERAVVRMKAFREERLKELTGREVKINDAETLASLRREALDVLTAVIQPVVPSADTHMQVMFDAIKNYSEQIGGVDVMDESDAKDALRVGILALEAAGLLKQVTASVTPPRPKNIIDLEELISKVKEETESACVVLPQDTGRPVGVLA